MRNEESKRREGMRCRKLLLLVALGAVGLLAATVVMAADPVPANACTTPNGWTIQTTGLDYLACGNATCTQIVYRVTSGGPPDHLATFVREEAGIPTTTGSSNISQLCAGDSVIGIANQNLCHERIVRFNNQTAKATTFTLSVTGRRLPLETSIVVRKGNSQGACAIVGFGAEAMPENLACVPNCTQVNPEQTMTKTEIVKFKGCAVKFEYDINTGEIILAEFDAEASDKPICPASVPCCYFNEQDVTNLSLSLSLPSGGSVDLGHGLFGDGYISSGSGSCTTRVIGGKAYTWGCPCP